MSDEIHPDWVEWRRIHQEWFSEHGIETVFDYLSEFGEFDELSASDLVSQSKDAGVYDELKQVGIHGFERPAVANSQDVMFLPINPRLTLKKGNFIERVGTDTTNYKLGRNSPKEPIVDLTLATGAGLNWLLNKSAGFGVDKEFIFPLIESLDEHNLIDLVGEVTEQEPKQNQHLSEEIYYTNLFKYATPGKGEVKTWQDKTVPSHVSESAPTESTVESGRGLMTAMVLEELKYIDPKVIIPFGDLSWTAFLNRTEGAATISPVGADYNHTPQDPHGSKGHQPSKVHGFLYEYREEDIETHILPLSFPGRPWSSFKTSGIMNDGEEPVEVNKERINTSIKYLSD